MKLSMCNRCSFSRDIINFYKKYIVIEWKHMLEVTSWRMMIEIERLNITSALQSILLSPS